MEIIIIIILMIVLLAIWVISTKRRLMTMDENVNNAMNQIGVQLSSCFDALSVLLDLTSVYVAYESRALHETIEAKRRAIVAISLPEEVLKPEEVIAEALRRIAMMAECCPELKADQNYVKYRNAVDSYEKMMRTSRLIYNDSVAKLNKTIGMISTVLIAGMLGFRRRDYFVSEGKAVYGEHTTQHMS